MKIKTKIRKQGKKRARTRIRNVFGLEPTLHMGTNKVLRAQGTSTPWRLRIIGYKSQLGEA